MCSIKQPAAAASFDRVCYIYNIYIQVNNIQQPRARSTESAKLYFQASARVNLVIPKWTDKPMGQNNNNR